MKKPKMNRLDNKLNKNIDSILDILLNHAPKQSTHTKVKESIVILTGCLFKIIYSYSEEEKYKDIIVHISKEIWKQLQNQKKRDQDEQ